jgi:glucan biosynthesis protein C
MTRNTDNKTMAGTPISVPISTRMAFFDNLRVLMMIMVIVHHVGQAYGPIGAWWPVQEPTRAKILAPFLMVNRSFGMSLFFMIAGYFTARSCDRSGPAGLVRSRFQRLGVPLLGFSLLMILLQVFVFGLLQTGELGPTWPIDVIHFWFVQQLLLYSLGYVLWRGLRRGAAKRTVHPTNPPGYGAILAFAIGLALTTAIVKTWYDTDEWLYLFGYIRIAPADLPRDLGLFLVGTVAYRNDWVTRFPARAGRVWLAVGLALAGLWYVYALWLADVVVFSDPVWGLLLPLWESLLCCGMCIGLTVVFRDRVNSQTPLAREMAQSTYAAYMLHVFVAVAFQSLALGLAVLPLFKFFLVSLVTVPVSFLLANLIRRPLRL